MKAVGGWYDSRIPSSLSPSPPPSLPPPPNPLDPDLQGEGAEGLKEEIPDLPENA